MVPYILLRDTPKAKPRCDGGVPLNESDSAANERVLNNNCNRLPFSRKNVANFLAKFGYCVKAVSIYGKGIIDTAIYMRADTNIRFARPYFRCLFSVHI